MQARRWTRLPDGGFIHSFNGAHSLFVDTIRSLRVARARRVLGQPLVEEQDAPVNLLDRLIQHARATARYNVYYGRGRDRFDVRGRVAHESLFNAVNGTYRGPSTQQGYSPFTTWTRGLAWAMLGFAEQLEFLDDPAGRALEQHGGRDAFTTIMLDAARATSDFYIDRRPRPTASRTGIPARPVSSRCRDWRDRPADPFNDHEPVDSSAAAIAAQGLLRLGHCLSARGHETEARRYEQAGLLSPRRSSMRADPISAAIPAHQGLLLHSVYHWPNGWDHVPAGARTPRGESSQWGDYHARELALYIKRLAAGAPYLAFFGREGRRIRGTGGRGTLRHKEWM